MIYAQDANGTYQRHVIDNVLANGHALTLVDIDGSGIPAIVAGDNRTRTNLFFYCAADKTGRSWIKMLMDNDMAASNCVDSDIRGIGRKTEVVCTEARPPFDLK